MEIIDVLTDRLRTLMKEHGVKAAPLARAAALNESAVRDILRGRSKNPGIVTLKKIASVLNLHPSALFEPGQVWPVVGKISEDGFIKSLSSSSRADYAIENPFFSYRDGDFEAAKVEGEHIAPLAFEGDYVIFVRKERGVDEDDIGRPCVCTLECGAKVVRIVRRGDRPAAYHLTPVSMFGAPEKNVSLAASARIAVVLPSEFVSGPPSTASPRPLN